VTYQQRWETIPEMVLSAADRFGDAEAVVGGPLRLSFVEVVHRIRCAAGAFAEFGVEKGDRVAIWAPNSAEWMIAAFGLLLLSAPMASADPMKCSGEQQACLANCAKLTDQTRLRACITNCSQRQAACRQTGCWNNGSSTYCGLMRQ